MQREEGPRVGGERRDGRQDVEPHDHVGEEIVAREFRFLSGGGLGGESFHDEPRLRPQAAQAFREVAQEQQHLGVRGRELRRQGDEPLAERRDLAVKGEDRQRRGGDRPRRVPELQAGEAGLDGVGRQAFVRRHRGRRRAGGGAGSSWVRQWSVPRPSTRSTA